MFVSATRWSSPLMSLLLVMSTLQPILQLPTVQSSVVHDIMRQIWQPSSNSSIITANRTLVNGLLKHFSITGMGKGERCTDTVVENRTAQSALKSCLFYQWHWTRLLDEHTPEYGCKELYCYRYCMDLVAHTYCTAEYAAIHRSVRQAVLNQSEGECKPWASWAPLLDSPTPLITSETTQCFRTLEANGVGPMCENVVVYRIALMGHIQDPTERECKTEFELERCLTEKACKYCTEPNEYLHFYASVWSPAKVECTKWDKPEMDCSAPTERPVLQSCLQLLTDKGESARCSAEAIAKYHNVSVENECKAKYYEYGCGMKAACSLCTDTSDFVFRTQAQLHLDDKHCRQWSSEEPKLECPSELAPTGQPCVESFKANPNASSALKVCNETQSPWIRLLDIAKSYEYKCKTSFTAAYCYNLVGRSFCTPDQYAEYRKVLQHALDAKAQYCKPWLNWAPPLDSPPRPTMSSITLCDDILFDGDGEETCDNEESQRMDEMDDIKDPIERACKEVFEMNKCMSREACKHCNESAYAYVNFYGNLWSPAKVECTKWVHEKPIKQCSSNTLLIVGIIFAVIINILGLISVVVYCEYFSSDKSESSSSKGDGSHGGSNKPPTPKFNQPKSSVEVKQSSRA